jgi:hypothetical protein
LCAAVDTGRRWKEGGCALAAWGWGKKSPLQATPKSRQVPAKRMMPRQMTGRIDAAAKCLLLEPAFCPLIQGSKTIGRDRVDDRDRWIGAEKFGFVWRCFEVLERREEES